MIRKNKCWRQLALVLILVCFLPIITWAALATDPQARYLDRQYKVLLVPGHDPEHVGARHLDLTEAELNLELARSLYRYLAPDPHFLVYSVRDLETGYYTEYFNRYFEEAAPMVDSFRRSRREHFARQINNGDLKPFVGINHNYAPDDVAFRLYAINKWANDHDIDLVLHIHFNDYPGRGRNHVGIYNGFAIYAPESQLGNASISRSIARSLYDAIGASVAPSNLPAERAGVVEDGGLIAVGSFGTRDGASLLVEYGYIYEPVLVDAISRPLWLKELAFQTYRGLKDYFQDAGVLSQKTLFLSLNK